MKAVLLRVDSAPVQTSFGLFPVKVSLSDRDSVSGILFSGKSSRDSPRSSSLQMKIKDQRSIIRRAFSETDLIFLKKEASKRFSKLSGVGSRSLPAMIPEKEEDLLEGEECEGGSSISNQRDLHRANCAGVLTGSHVLPVDPVVSGDGEGNGRNGKRKTGGGGGDDRTGSVTGGSADRSKICAYYEEMLKADPGNHLVLRNYGKFLHEVEKDLVKAEEYYGRAILASPGDGEVLSLYGKLIWETQKDGARAKVYFDQAVQASPDDCYVLGAYAQFLWDADEDEEETEKETEEVKIPPILVEAVF